MIEVTSMYPKAFKNGKKVDITNHQKIENTPTPWLTLLLVLGKSRVKQNSC